MQPIADLVGGALQLLVPVFPEIAEAARRVEPWWRSGDGVRRTGEIGVRARGVGGGVERGGLGWLLGKELLLGDAEAAEFEAELRGVEVLRLEGLGEAAGGDEGAAVGDGEGSPGHGLHGLGEDKEDRILVFEEGDVDGDSGILIWPTLAV